MVDRLSMNLRSEVSRERSRACEGLDRQRSALLIALLRLTNDARQTRLHRCNSRTHSVAFAGPPEVDALVPRALAMHDRIRLESVMSMFAGPMAYAGVMEGSHHDRSRNTRAL